MAKIFLICGKICSGKSYYCRDLIQKKQAVLISCDELMQTLFPDTMSEMHDSVIGNVHTYLLNKAVEIVSCNSNVILDWGFWSKADRQSMSDYLKGKQIAYEWHFIDVSDKQWQQNIDSRNKAITAGKSKDYYLDDGLLAKLFSFYEKPDETEIDVWYRYGD